MTACKCEEKEKPIAKRAWEIALYKGIPGHWGQFIGQSNYSDMVCCNCRAVWRTKAKYVDVIYKRDKNL